MLPKKFRLSRQEFKDVMKDGKMASGKLMGILIAQNSKVKTQNLLPKAGIIVSKKLSNKAVVRNKLKRRLRAALQNILPETLGIHLVILPNRRTIDATVEDLKKEIGHLIIKN
ncbi:ribonuclease P protein component [Candidatus Collierbacteria bacterium]|nr:ribonuclease P protein component [Candidatus Collierbacteria bacterium]